MTELSEQTILRDWQHAGWIRHLDVQFARFIGEETNAQYPAVVMLAGLLSWQLSRGHICVDLSQLLADPNNTLGLPPEHSKLHSVPTPNDVIGSASIAKLESELNQSGVISGSASPFVLKNQRLYMRRYWTYEQEVVRGLNQRMVHQPIVNDEELARALSDSFQDNNEQPNQTSWQQVACANALRSRFSVITGGPGTGKTYTVVRLLQILWSLKGQALNIRLAAPTGKAAARMTESIRNELSKLTDELTDTVPVATTLHKLLGSKRGTRAFRHNQDNPLHADIVIVDEASMVDLENMAALINALPEKCSLVLLGDKDQLASVEAGAVLGQLCEGSDEGGYNEQTLNWLQGVTATDQIPNQQSNSGSHRVLQHIVKLRESRRFDENSGIGKLAREVNRQHTDWVRHWIDTGQPSEGESQQLYESLSLVKQPVSGVHFKELCIQGYSVFHQQAQSQPESSMTNAELDHWAKGVLDLFNNFQLLCVQRKGDSGVEAINEKVKGWLAPETPEQWYIGRPVMVTRNDYAQQLTNGDIGVLLRRRPDEKPRVAFLTTDAEQPVRWVLPSRLVQTETAYAMTVHKSQGSEFEHTVLVLPERDVPVMTKELLYTGITRAKSRLTLICPTPDIFFTGLTRAVQRSGGLTEELQVHEGSEHEAD